MSVVPCHPYQYLSIVTQNELHIRKIVEESREDEAQGMLSCFDMKTPW